MAVVDYLASPLKEWVTSYVKKVTEIDGIAIDNYRNFMLGIDPETDSLSFPAYARGIGQVYITAGTGQNLTDGTIYLPSQSATGETVIFSAGSLSTSGQVQYRNVITSENTTKNFYFSKSGTNYYYYPQENISGDRIRIFWNGTYSNKEIYGVYILTGGYPSAFPANINGSANNYMCRLKYWTFNSFKNTTVNNNSGLNVPDEYNYTFNINIPVGGDNVTFNEYRNTVIQQYNTYITNNNLQEETINPSEPPPELDYDNIVDLVYPEPTEPTEPPTSPIYNIDIDYNRIVSPTDLDNALNAEQYTDIQVDTGILSLDSSAQIPTETFDNNFLLVIPSAVQSGKTLFSTLGIWNIFLPCAVLLAVFAIFKR